ncbi:MAG: VTT domain-containing protein [Bacteroidota bacterium]
MLEKGKKIIYLLWLGVILGLLCVYLANPSIATPEYFVYFMGQFEYQMMTIYIVISMLRGFFMIPSTPFVIGGGLLFPDKLGLVLLISMIGIMFSATALYYFSDLLGFSKYLEKRNPAGIGKWKKRLQHPKATLLVTAWGFFPLVPTDLICYVAGIVKMPFRYMFIGVFAGELLLDICYVYFGAQLFDFIV